MLTPIAENVLKTRYLQKDSKGNPVETIDGLWRRVARHASAVEQDKEHWENEIYNLLSNQLFLFNSPTLVNAGTPINGLSACFVVGMEDSIDGIWNAKRNFAKIAQKGGGAGINICDLRPKNDPVSGSTHAKAGGPVAFLETFWKDMEAITQAGFRQMACMAVMRVDHPDILEFITCKHPVKALAATLSTNYAPMSLTEAEQLWNSIKSATNHTVEQTRIIKLVENYLSNFNISVGVTDAFMSAVETDSDFDLVFGGKVYQTVKARDIWTSIAANAWASGDPGLMFLDTTNNNSPYRYSGQVIKATNPCGEQGLPAKGVCNLGSVDVSKFVRRELIDAATWFDWEAYIEVCKIATRALNNIVDIASWPTEEIKQWVEENRPIGLGDMGFADACLALGMRYGGNESIEFARELTARMYDAAESVSIELGQERGIPEACKNLPVPRRNVTLLSIAPTGTISLIAGCSSGCEPVFQFVQVRQDNTGSYVMVHPAIKQRLGIDDLVFEKGTEYSILNNEAAKILNWAKSAMSDIMVSADEVSVEDHIKVQAAFQVAYGDGRCVDSGVSKTINMPNSATVEDVRNAYLLAHKLGCKGITIYRDGSKYFQILSTVKAEAPKEDTVTDDYDIVPAKRFKMTYKGNRWYVIVGENNGGKPTEVFLSTNVQDDTIPTTEALARMISLALRYKVPLTKVISQLRKVRGYSIGTFPSMIVRALDHYIKADVEQFEKGGYTCSECNSGNVELVGGCPTCKDCGYSRCG
jgi:ribonucleoside-diphosphate reductase alpha chain